LLYISQRQHDLISFILFYLDFKQDATNLGDKVTFFTHMCAGRSAATSEHRIRNPAITW